MGERGGDEEACWCGSVGVGKEWGNFQRMRCDGAVGSSEEREPSWIRDMKIEVDVAESSAWKVSVFPLLHSTALEATLM